MCIPKPTIMTYIPTYIMIHETCPLHSSHHSFKKKKIIIKLLSENSPGDQKYCNQ